MYRRRLLLGWRHLFKYPAANTLLEAVLDDNPRRDSLIFTVDIWNPDGAKPESLWEVATREKDIQYASRAHSHSARQKQIHHLRHVILEFTKAIPDKQRASPEIKALAAWGCKTTMHVVRLVASGIEGVIIHDPPVSSAPPLAKDIDGFKGKTK